MNSAKNDWWRPASGSKWDQRIQFGAAAIGIVGSSFALALLTWSLASSPDGRVKALLWWCYGVTAVLAFIVFQIIKRENAETRYGRSLSTFHEAHHLLRDASYARYIARTPETDWTRLVEASLQAFASSFSVAAGAPCHATIKRLVDSDGPLGRADQAVENLEVVTTVRSGTRATTVRPGVTKNTVGLNTDFRMLFRPDSENRCWYQDDLLKLDLYENPHWPERPNPKNVPYRSTMVWPIRKVLREGTATAASELYIHGFLTIDSPETNIFRFERHFHLGAAYADHLLSVLWDSEKLRDVHIEISTST